MILARNRDPFSQSIPADKHLKKPHPSEVGLFGLRLQANVGAQPGETTPAPIFAANALKAESFFISGLIFAE